MKRVFSTAVSLVVATLLLAGCQTAPTINAPLAGDASQLTHWQLSGRMGYSNGVDGGSAGITWKQLKIGQGRLSLSGPLGFGHAVISYDANGAQLDTGKKIIRAANASELAWRVTGLALPIPALSWWVRALAWPAAPIDARQLNPNGQLAALTQAGWSLVFDRYQTHGGLALPGRIKARKGDTRFTLLISSWSSLPEGSIAP